MITSYFQLMNLARAKSWKNNSEYPYTAYEYQGTQYNGDLYGKQYYDVIYGGEFDEDNVPYIP